MAACERCPSPGACGGVCPLLRRPLTGEFGKKVLAGPSIKPLLEKQELPNVIFRFSPDPVRQGGEPPTPVKTGEVICFICKEKASTCSHSKSETFAKAA